MNGSKKALFLSTTPGLILLVLFYSLAAHMFFSLGQWPDSIGENGFPRLLVFHASLSTGYFSFLYLLTVYVAPGIFVLLLTIKPWRKFSLCLVAHVITFWVVYGCILLAPAKFLS
jgi:hypothetical protein